MAGTSSAGTNDSTDRLIIPGQYEPGGLFNDRSGAMSGPAYGSDDQPQGPEPIDAETIKERQKEGGGALPRR